ncbi:MAG TPA: manganese efflux pump [Trebonia sp.]|nr:manganese efflux pump [Trebonia sp.]
MIKLLAFTLPLCLDNFAIAFAVLGEIKLTRAQLLRVTIIFMTFEATMPLIGLAIGTPLIHLIAGPPHINIDPYQLGSPTEIKELQQAYRSHLADVIDLTFVGRYIVPLVVPVIVGAIGLLMLDEAFNDDDDDDEAEKARALVAARGRAIIGLGISISVDELVVGFTIGYSQYFTTPEAIIAIVVQSFLALMAGLYFGRKVREGKFRISVERVSTGTKLIAGGILVTLSAVLLVGPPLASHAFPHFIHSVFPHKVRPAPAPSAVTTSLPGSDG